MAAAVVQSSTLAVLDNQGATSTHSFASSVTAGNAVVVMLTGFNRGTFTNPLVASITDNKGNTYYQAIQQDLNGFNGAWSQIFYAWNVTGGASFTITINYSVSSPAQNKCTVVMSEVSGLASSPLDTTAGAGIATSSSGQTVGPTTTTSQADAIVFSILGTGGDYTANINLNIPTGYTNIGVNNNVSTDVYGARAVYKILSATGQQSAVYTHNTSPYGNTGALAVFKAATSTDQRFKFYTDPSAISATGCTILVWANTAIVGTEIAEITGRSFQGTLDAGRAVIYGSANGYGLANGTTVLGVIFNSTKTTGLISGVVEAGTA